MILVLQFFLKYNTYNFYSMRTNLSIIRPIIVLLILLLLCFEGNSQIVTVNKIWKGTVDKNFKNCSNYNMGVCPADTDNVEVPLGCAFSPMIYSTTNVTIRNLNLSANTFHGPQGKSATTFNTMEVSGYLLITGDLTIQFPSQLIINPGGSVTVMGNTVITSPSSIANSVLVINNNGSFISGCNVSYLPYNVSPYHGTGYPLVYRTIAQDLKWHLLSSPVLTQPIANKDFAPAPNTFTQVPVTAWDFYKWLSVCPDPPYNDNWRNLRNDNGTQNYMDFGYPSYFESGKGYLVSYADWHQNNTVFVNYLSKQFYGPLNSCCEGWDFHNSTAQCPYFWELIGNPFTSAIDWSQITYKENLVSNYYYVYNDYKDGGAGYEYWGDPHHHSDGVDGFIPMAQGFFVQVLTDEGRYLGLPYSARIHHNSTDNWLKEASVSNELTLKLSNGTNWDKASVVFEADGTAGRDRNDAEKMFSMAVEVPQIYTIIDNTVKASLNSLPYSSEAVTVPVGFIVPANGEYTFTIDGLANFTSLTGLVLEDLNTNTTQDMLRNPVYTFSASGNEDAGRFLLHFAGPIGVNGNMSEEKIDIYSSGHTIYIHSSGSLLNAQVTVFNLLGQNILSKKLQNTSVNILDVENGEGYYIVKVQAGSRHNIGRVFIR
jgi:hypothetical protein